MALYRINEKSLDKIDQTTFADQGIKERADLQRLLKQDIQALADDIMVIAEEFGEWEGSNRRVDLLALDRNANIVVIELKRTQDGGHMELQAIRYASMLSTITFDQAVRAFTEYMKANDIEGDAEEVILDFLGWEQGDDDRFAQDVRIILASAEFSRELVTSVIWLNERNLDIQCISMKPYRDGDNTLLNFQQVIPLPEASDYQIKVREKQQRERQSRTNNRDLTRYDLTVNGREYSGLAKRWLMYRIVCAMIERGLTPDEVLAAIPWRNNLFISFEGELDSEQFITELMANDKGGAVALSKRYFCDAGELFVHNGRTYAFTNQWGRRTLDAVESFSKACPEMGLVLEAVE